MGIEPTALAWEARVLPLYDARSGQQAAILCAEGGRFNLSQESASVRYWPAWKSSGASSLAWA